MSTEVLKSELSKLERAELLDVLQFGLEVMKKMEEGGFETPTWHPRTKTNGVDCRSQF